MRIRAAIFAVLFWGFAAPAFATTLGEVSSGSLLFKTEMPGRRIAAPVVATDVKIDVTGPIARTVMTQRFRNPSDGWVEGIYAFPLPKDAAVDTLRMRIGDRFVEGRIEEKIAAQEIYEDAKAEGKAAALVEQHRPNLFTTSVANIAPGAVVVAQIEFQSTLAPKDGLFSLRMPLVAAPRYGGVPIVQAIAFGPEGWAVTTPETPVADPREEDPETVRNPVTMEIDFAPGFPVSRLESRYHDVEIEEREGGALVTLTGPVPADRDFELIWAAEQGAEPAAAVFTETSGEDRHMILTLSPPKIEAEAARLPRDVIFVQDVSGSMAGESIRQARAGLETAIKRLTPDDRFTILAFNDDYALWSPKVLPATPATVRRAVREVRGLDAEGGTNMLPALDRALRIPSEPGRLRQIIFLTDGAVSFEAEMLDLIHQRRGGARVFMVGIGSAPNGYFMTRAAEIGRGAHVYIGDLGEVREKMEALFAKIEAPAITDLALDLPVGVTAAPSILPDLYAGEPLTVALKGAVDAPIRLTGRRGERPFEMTLDLAQAPERAGVAKLFARRRIAGLEAERLTGGDPLAVDAEIMTTALDYGLVSRLTSLIAVDDAPVRPFAEPLTRAEVARNLPAGWDPAQFVFEQTPVVRAPGERAELPGLIKATTPVQDAAPTVAVPQGSLGWRLSLLIGLIMIALGWLARPRGSLA
ncbi:MAG: marine proteobacterial sortase target protein [Pseudomonadota bacterium]